MRIINSLFVIASVLLGTNAVASTRSVVKILSAKMQKKVPVTIILPDAYGVGNERWPVLYLLHGAGDNHAKWNKLTPIRQLADRHGIIIVCPDAGRTSWFFDSPTDPKYQYETFTAKELVAYVDSKYRTMADRRFRAIAGISMGGHGAMFLGIRHKDVFSVVCCMSGGVDIRPFANKWNIKRRIGTIKANPELWNKLTVINLAKTLKNGDLAISIDCGSSDFFLRVNRNLHKQLIADKIDHDYMERPGGHGWDYWKYSILLQMEFINTKFTAAKVAVQTTNELGNTALIAVPQLEKDGYDWLSRHEDVKALGKSRKPDIVLIGDSITHYWGGLPRARPARGVKVWRNLMGDRALNLGFGWDRIQNVLWRIEHGEMEGVDPKYVIINVGTNNLSKTPRCRDNTPQEIAAGIETLCLKLTHKHPRAKIILMGIFPRGKSRRGVSYNDRIIRVNALLKKLVLKNVTFLDIGKKFVDDRGVPKKSLMGDLCHPTAAGYAIWADALAKELVK